MSTGGAALITTLTGGGCGNPLDRPIEKVVMDLKNGFIKLEQSMADYGVKIAPATFEVVGLSLERENKDK